MLKALIRIRDKSFPLVGFSTASIGFGADILQPLGPLISYIFFASVFAASALLITMIVKSSLRTILAKSFIFVLSMMVFSGGFYFSNDEESIDTGIIASTFPAIKNLQSTLGLIEKDIIEIKKLTENIKKNTQENIEATKKVAEAVQDSTEQIIGSLAEMQKEFSEIAQSGGVIANPTRPEQFYHNARVQEQGGDYLNARKNYNRFFSFKLDFIDPHLRYQTFLKIQEGRAGAREIYSSIYESDPRSIVEFARILLFDAPHRTEMLKKFIEKNPDFAPAYYELSREFSEDRKGKQTLKDKRSELEALQKFSKYSNQGNFVKYFIDKEITTKWINNSERRLLSLNKNTNLLMPISFTIQPYTKNITEKLCCEPTFCFSTEECRTKVCKGDDWKPFDIKGYCRRETKEITKSSEYLEIFIQIPEEASKPILSTAWVLPNCTGLWSTSNWNNCFTTYTWKNGDKYAGAWKNGKLHGHGTYTYLDGSKWVGEWKNGKLNGYAITYQPDGSINQKGIFKDDEFALGLSKPSMNTVSDNEKRMYELDVEKLKISNNSTEFYSYIRPNRLSDEANLFISYLDASDEKQGPYKISIDKDKISLIFIEKLISKNVDINLPINDRRIKGTSGFPYNNILNKLNIFELRRVNLLASASALNQISVVEKLLSLGASVDGYKIDKRPQQCNLTPLIISVHNERNKIAKILIDNGANIELSSRFGDVTDVATCNKNEELLNIIRDSKMYKAHPCRCGNKNSTECGEHLGEGRANLSKCKNLLSISKR